MSSARYSTFGDGHPADPKHIGKHCECVCEVVPQKIVHRIAILVTNWGNLFELQSEKSLLRFDDTFSFHSKNCSSLYWS